MCLSLQRKEKELKHKTNPIKKWRVRRGMTQTELGAAIGQKQPVIARWEGGLTPSLKNLRRLSEALEVNVEELIEW